MRTIVGLSLAAVLAAASAAFAGNPCVCGVTVVQSAPAAPGVAVAQANQGYRSFSYEPAAAAQVPQGGQVYRSYSYAPATPTYSSNYNRGPNYGGRPAYMVQKSMR